MSRRPGSADEDAVVAEGGDAQERGCRPKTCSRARPPAPRARRHHVDERRTADEKGRGAWRRRMRSPSGPPSCVARSKAARSPAPSARPHNCSAAVAIPSRKKASDQNEIVAAPRWRQGRHRRHALPGRRRRRTPKQITQAVRIMMSRLTASMRAKRLSNAGARPPSRSRSARRAGASTSDTCTKTTLRNSAASSGERPAHRRR